MINAAKIFVPVELLSKLMLTFSAMPCVTREWVCILSAGVI